MIICICKSVSDTDINNAIDSGVSSFDGMQNALGVATQCGSCECEVKELLANRDGSKAISCDQQKSINQTVHVAVSPITKPSIAGISA